MPGIYRTFYVQFGVGRRLTCLRLQVFFFIELAFVLLHKLCLHAVPSAAYQYCRGCFGAEGRFRAGKRVVYFAVATSIMALYTAARTS